MHKGGGPTGNRVAGAVQGSGLIAVLLKQPGYEGVGGDLRVVMLIRRDRAVSARAGAAGMFSGVRPCACARAHGSELARANLGDNLDLRVVDFVRGQSRGRARLAVAAAVANAAKLFFGKAARRRRRQIRGCVGPLEGQDVSALSQQTRQPITLFLVVGDQLFQACQKDAANGRLVSARCQYQL